MSTTFAIRVPRQDYEDEEDFPYGNVYGTCVIDEEWQDVPMQDNP